MGRMGSEAAGGSYYHGGKPTDRPRGEESDQEPDLSVTDSDPEELSINEEPEIPSISEDQVQDDKEPQESRTSNEPLFARVEMTLRGKTVKFLLSSIHVWCYY